MTIMNSKILQFLLLSIFIVSCSVNSRREAINIISEFEQSKAIDKRETVFDVEPLFNNKKLILSGETDNPELKRELLELLKHLEVTDQITMLPDSTVGKKTFGLINLSVANLRSAPRHSAQLATQALLGTPVKILKVENGWHLIQTPDKYISWVDDAGIEPVSKEQFTNWKHSKKIILTSNSTIVFTKDFKSTVSDITLGNILVELERNYKRIKVQFPDGRVGYADSKAWVDFEEFKNTITIDTTQLKQMAESFMGRPYLWGGTSARAMDCSGFVKTLYFMNGIILARDASLQTKFGEVIDTKIGFEKVETGDLLFFGRKATKELNEKVTHVAFSVGETEYIHAAGRIKRNSFDIKSKIFSEHRKNSFVRARRIMGFEGTDGIQQIKNHPWY